MLGRLLFVRILLAAVFTVAGTSVVAVAAPPELPCALAMIDGQMFATGNVPVHIFSAAPCEGAEVVNNGGFINHLRISLDRRTTQRVDDLVWGRVYDIAIKFPVGRGAREKVVDFLDLPDGRYRLTLTEGFRYLDAYHFAVGSVSDDVRSFDPTDRLPYLRAARVVEDGNIYFRGRLGRSGATGFVYQTQSNKTLVFAAEYEELDSQDRVYLNLPFVRGGVYDMGWVRAKLPPLATKLNPNGPIFASVTADRGGITVQGMIFDPLDPNASVGSFTRASR